MTYPLHTEFIMVFWMDAHSPSAGDSYTKTSVGEVHGSLPVLTSGWLLREDAEGVTVASEWYVDEATFRGLTHVPAGMVREIVRLKLPTTKKKRLPKEPLDSVPTS